MRLLIASALFALSTIAVAADLKVDAPWTRSTLPTQKAAGAFMTLTSAQDAVLVGASSPLAEKAEIHEMKTEGGVMKMSPVANLPLPAGKAVELKSGGNHIMLWGLKQQLKAGEKLPLELQIESGGKRETVKVEAEIRPLNTSAH
ncbi:MAG: copper chaperone PCu(A)C [Betaproteobacteria bacterium]|nr:copper chaperone PCu(A)C [Betaproteobacteria bacterium]